ncbi:MAG: response regulator [Oligoflexales bacterium]
MNRMKILVVDDDQAICSLMVKIIKGLGCEAQTCANGKEALEALTSNNFTLMILDLIMPNMGGVETLKEIRKRGININTVVLSGFISHDIRKQCKKFGAKRFLEKPIEISDIEGLLKGEKESNMKINVLEDIFD